MMCQRLPTSGVSETEVDYLLITVLSGMRIPHVTSCTISIKYSICSGNFVNDLSPPATINYRKFMALQELRLNNGLLIDWAGIRLPLRPIFLDVLN